MKYNRLKFRKQNLYILPILKKLIFLSFIIIASIGICICANARNNRSQRQNVAVKQHEEVIPRGDCVTIILINFRKDLPLVRFKNPHITTRIYDEIKRKKYLKSKDDSLFIALTPDSTLILSLSRNGIWVNSGKTYKERCEHAYCDFVGHIKYNHRIIPIITDKYHPISWIELDSTQTVNDSIIFNGFSKWRIWSIIPVSSMLSEPEPIDSLTRNEMIHSWFDR